MHVELTAAADLELTEAAAWYMERSLEVARAFLVEFARVKGLVEESLTRWREIEPGIRRLPFRRFPYALIYTEEPGRVLVLAVMHQGAIPGIGRVGARKSASLKCRAQVSIGQFPSNAKLRDYARRFKERSAD